MLAIALIPLFVFFGPVLANIPPPARFRPGMLTVFQKSGSPGGMSGGRIQKNLALLRDLPGSGEIPAEEQTPGRSIHGRSLASYTFRPRTGWTD